ncbi:Flagellar biosynthesis pathway, component FlhB [Rubellimicrobium thermophilum DSM 16684]|uniref:Flagellar biosynthesis pathway, component FlhB n=1 Tax=Rubellimicrobium thermophilum DSM 16684 TaxID=1123069 RepID=S9S1S2_9RHOB|nr:EscU/YscU/HrcU family type III secretion system export apparatus switch protein [Rubellimicrobium thermophilum]EPX84165.1 Flagellar biosynthesis pathway, component FlhB [Rubellimicrobium thermophilum DSM 16684]
MSDGNDQGEKSFEPTQKRLEEARRRGDVAQSPDLVTAAAYGGFLLAVLAFGAGSLVTLGGLLTTLLAQAGPLSEAAFGASGKPLGGAVLGRVAGALGPWLALPAIAALLTLLAQGALVVAPERLRPRGSRLSPLAQARQRFGPEGLAEFLKALLKLTAYATVLGHSLAAATPRLIGGAAQDARVAMTGMLTLLTDLLAKVVLVACVLGIADLVWQRLRQRRRLMMTRREMTEEMKESEGDPHMRQERRSRGRSIAMNRMLDAVPTATVVIVNPTHYAVALRWDPAAGGAPICVAKGVDEMAARIRERAVAAGVPIRRDPPTARAIFATVDLGEAVARPEWRAVAAAIRFAERVRNRAKGKGP